MGEFSQGVAVEYIYIVLYIVAASGSENAVEPFVSPKD